MADDTIVWQHPDVPHPDDVHGDDDVEFDCPGECDEYHIFEDFGDRDDLVAYIESEDGVIVCNYCDEPLYHIQL